MVKTLKLSENESKMIISKLNFRYEQDTVIAVIQDYLTKEVLMVGHMNKEALFKTLTTGLLHFWSISKKKIWLKGETSGNYQYVEEIKVDCDGDAVVFLVKSKRPICHTGMRSCFYRNYNDLLISKEYNL